jgi:hypothetical protein
MKTVALFLAAVACVGCPISAQAQKNTNAAADPVAKGDAIPPASSHETPAKRAARYQREDAEYARQMADYNRQMAKRDATIEADRDAMRSGQAEHDRQVAEQRAAEERHAQEVAAWQAGVDAAAARAAAAQADYDRRIAEWRRSGGK